MSLDAFDAVIYLPDGEYAGQHRWRLSDLSERWLAVCDDILGYYGPIFKHNMGSTLAHFEIRFTAGIAHYFSRGHLAFSAVYLSGVSSVQDLNLLTAFINQLPPQVKKVGADGTGLRERLGMHAERPLSISILWANEAVHETDDEALFQLSNHLAASYLCRYVSAGSA